MIGAQNHEVFDVGAIEFNRTVDEIVEARRALRHTKSHGPRTMGRFTRRDLGRCQSKTCAVVLPRTASSFCRFAFRLELLRRAVTEIRLLLFDELIGHRAMPVETLRLKVRPEGTANERAFIPIEPQPTHPIEDALNH